MPACTRLPSAAVQPVENKSAVFLKKYVNRLTAAFENRTVQTEVLTVNVPQLAKVVLQPAARLEPTARMRTARDGVLRIARPQALVGVGIDRSRSKCTIRSMEPYEARPLKAIRRPPSVEVSPSPLPRKALIPRI